MPYEGGETAELDVDLGSIPLFIKSGGIIPMALNQMDNFSTQTVTGLSILCEAGRDGAFTLYEDDGLTMDYEKGAWPYYGL